MRPYRSALSYCLSGPISFKYRDDVAACRRYVYSGYKVLFRERSGIGVFCPIFDTTGTRVIRGERHCCFGRKPSILFAQLFQVPTANLDVAFRISEEFICIFRRLLLIFFKTGFLCPFAANQRRHLHKSYLVGSAYLPCTKICFFIDQAPDKLFIKAIDPSLSRDQLIIPMNPIVGEEEPCRKQDNDQDDGDGDQITTHLWVHGPWGPFAPRHVFFFFHGRTIDRAVEAVFACGRVTCSRQFSEKLDVVIGLVSHLAPDLKQNFQELRSSVHKPIVNNCSPLAAIRQTHGIGDEAILLNKTEGRNLIKSGRRKTVVWSARDKLTQ